MTHPQDPSPAPRAPATPAEFETQEVLSFVTSALPSTSASILEVGCGEGRLAAELQAAGFQVEAVDRSADAVAAARERGVDARCIDVLEFDGGPYDAVLFTRSLHHVWPLDEAIQKAWQLTAPGGLLVIDDFAHDAVDLASAAWFYDMVAALEEVGAIDPDATSSHHHHGHHGHHGHHEEADQPPASPLERWQRRIEHDPPLHKGQPMLDELGENFEILREERTPNFYRLMARWLPATEEGVHMVSAIRELEQGLGDAGLLVPFGLRIVARRPSTT